MIVVFFLFGLFAVSSAFDPRNFVIPYAPGVREALLKQNDFLGRLETRKPAATQLFVQPQWVQHLNPLQNQNQFNTLNSRYTEKPISSAVHSKPIIIRNPQYQLVSLRDQTSAGYPQPQPISTGTLQWGYPQPQPAPQPQPISPGYPQPQPAPQPQPISPGYPQPQPAPQPQPISPGYPQPQPAPQPQPISPGYPQPQPAPQPQPISPGYPQPQPQPISPGYPQPQPQPISPGYPQPQPQPISPGYPQPQPQPISPGYPQPQPAPQPQPISPGYPQPQPAPQPQPISPGYPQPQPAPQPQPISPGYPQPQPQPISPGYPQPQPAPQPQPISPGYPQPQPSPGNPSEPSGEQLIYPEIQPPDFEEEEEPNEENLQTIDQQSESSQLAIECRAPRGQFSSSRACNKFLNCWDGVAVEQDCGGGLLFNEEYGYCDFPKNVHCGTRPIERKEALSENSKCPESYGKYRSESNCAEFIICSDSIPHKFACPGGLAYNDELGVCDYPYRVDCKGIPFMPPEVEESTNNNNVTATVTTESTQWSYGPPARSQRCQSGTVYRMSRQCETVALCIDGRKAVVTCPTGMAFDVVDGQCVALHNSRC